MFLFDKEGRMPPEGSYLVLPIKRKNCYKLIHIVSRKKFKKFPFYLQDQAGLQLFEARGKHLVYAKYGEY